MKNVQNYEYFDQFIILEKWKMYIQLFQVYGHHWAKQVVAPLNSLQMQALLGVLLVTDLQN